MRWIIFTWMILVFVACAHSQGYISAINRGSATSSLSGGLNYGIGYGAGYRYGQQRACYSAAVYGGANTYSAGGQYGQSGVDIQRLYMVYGIGFGMGYMDGYQAGCYAYRGSNFVNPYGNMGMIPRYF